MRRLIFAIVLGFLIGSLAIPLGAQNYVWGAINGVPFAPGFRLIGSPGNITWPLGSILTEDGVDTLAQRRGTNTQEFRVYQSYTDASNGRWLGLLGGFSANSPGVYATGNGSGASPNLYVGASGTNIIVLNDIIFNTDNNDDIGANLATRPRNLYLGSKILNYNAIATAGHGVPAVYGYGDAAAVVNTGTASIATYTPAADGTFEVGCNILVTASATHSFSCDVTYTDEGSSARTMILPVESLVSGNFASGGLITAALGVGAYESTVMVIRAKASTAITVRTSAGGTFTSVTYNARGVIKQVG